MSDLALGFLLGLAAALLLSLAHHIGIRASFAIGGRARFAVEVVRTVFLSFCACVSLAQGFLESVTRRIVRSVTFQLLNFCGLLGRIPRGVFWCLGLFWVVQFLGKLWEVFLSVLGVLGRVFHGWGGSFRATGRCHSPQRGGNPTSEGPSWGGFEADSSESDSVPERESAPVQPHPGKAPSPAVFVNGDPSTDGARGTSPTSSQHPSPPKPYEQCRDSSRTGWCW